MNQSFFVRASFLIVVSMLLAGTHAGLAQSDGDDTLNGMPKAQKEHYARFLELSKQNTQAIKTKNPVAKKEALDKVAGDTREQLKSINDMLAKDGAQGWIGEAGIVPGYLNLHYTRKKDPALFIHFSIPTKGMSKDVLDVVKTLAKGDKVQFTIAADERNPAKMSGSKHSFTVQVAPQLLKSLAISK